MGLILVDEVQRVWDMEPVQDDTLDTHYLTKKITKVLKSEKFEKYPTFHYDLPGDLVMMIMRIHIDWLIKQTRFTEAFVKIALYPTLVSRYFKRYCNEDLLHDDRSKNSAMLAALHWIFQFADCVFNDTLKKKNTMTSNSIYFEISSMFRFNGFTVSPRKVFNKFNVNVSDLSEFVRMETPEDGGLSLLAISSGSRYADIIWFNGVYTPLHPGLFQYDTKEYPVIILCIVDADNNYLKADEAKQITGWEECIDLFHYVGGPHTSVYFCESMDDELEFTINKYMRF